MPSPSPRTRGFLFADLRGYSRFTEEHGDRAAGEMIRRYRDLVRERIAAFDGAEIRTEGDSFYVVFSSVSHAVQAGLAIRDAAVRSSDQPGVTPIRIGIGVHAGETEDGTDGIVSSAVNIAARVCSVAEPGELLVTDTVRSLTRSLLRISFTARGRRKLKGISEPIAVYAVDTAAGPATSSRPSERRMRTLVAAIAGVGLVAVVVSVVLSGRPSPTAVDASPPVSSANQEVISSSTPGPSRRAAFPDPAEAALLERLPSSVQASCRRADPDDVPVFEQFVRVLDPSRVIRTLPAQPLTVVAGLSCLTELNSVVYWESLNRGRVEEVLFQEIGKRGVPRGSCDEQGRAHEPWDIGPLSGTLMCYASASRPLIWWTYHDSPVLAIASRGDGDADALLAWWRETGRLLGR